MAKDEIVDVQTSDEPKKDTLAMALVIFTTVALLVGFLVFENALAKYYDGGMFGK